MDTERHLQVANYADSIPNLKTDRLTYSSCANGRMHVRKAYKLAAKTNGIRIKNRSYKTEEWDQADPVIRYMKRMLCYMDFAMLQLFHWDILPGLDLFIQVNSFLLYMM